MPEPREFFINQVLEYTDIFQDPWNDANMGQVLEYLAQSKKMQSDKWSEWMHELVEMLPWAEFDNQSVA